MGPVTVLGPGDTEMGKRLSGGPQTNLYGSPSIFKEEAVSLPENPMPEAETNKPTHKNTPQES